jgi:hypothetical protein
LGCILEVSVEGMVPDLNKGHADVSIIVDPHLDLIELLKLSVDLLESGLFERAGAKLIVVSATRAYLLGLILVDIACLSCQGWSIQAFKAVRLAMLLIHAC